MQNKILIGLVILNQFLLILYFTFHVKDSEIDIAKTTQTLFKIHHQPDESELYYSYSEEEYFSEDISSDLPANLDVLYKDEHDTLEIIGDDTDLSQNKYLKESLSRINPIKLPFEQRHVREQQQLKLIKDPNYCNLNDLFFITHKFIPLHVVTDYNVDSPVAKTIEKIGKDVLPAVPLYSNQQFHLPLDTAIYFMMNLNFYKYFAVGTEAVCAFQTINFIPGAEQLLEKSQLYGLLRVLKLPLPKTYIMNNQTECKAFFAELKNLSLEDYFYKNALGNKKGSAERLLRKFHFGELCGEIVEDLVLQVSVKVTRRLFHIITVHQTHPLLMKFVDGHYYEKKKGNYTYSDYNETTSQRLRNISETVIAHTEFTQDHRFFQIFRFEYLESESEIFLVSVNSKLDKDRSQEEFISRVLSETLTTQHKLQNERSLKFRQQYIQF